MIEGVYSREQHMGEKRGFRKCKGGIRGIQKKDECGGEETRKVRYGREKEFQERRITRKIYGKDVVWMG